MSLLFAGIIATSKNCFAASREPHQGQDHSDRLLLSGDIKGALTYSNFDSDTDVLTRLRLQLDLRPTSNLQFVGRINEAKLFEGEGTEEDTFLVDRFYLLWRDIAGAPVSLSAGRLPTMGESSPAHLRLGLDHPNGEFHPFFNIALDGAALEYSYQKPFTGKIGFYYGSQFDEGYESNENNNPLADTDIYGLKWDIFENNCRSISLQSFQSDDIWNWSKHVTVKLGNIFIPRVELGDVHETSLTYVESWPNFTFFVSGGWSHTNSKKLDDLGTGLLSSWFDRPKDEDGFCLYTGFRYDLDDLKSKIGLEFNHGSKYWINFTQDAETGKLATRGSVAEVYWIVEPALPSGLAKEFKTVIGRIGYQFYDYTYTGSGFLLGEPLKVDRIKNNPFSVQFYQPVDTEYRVYAAVEMYF